MARFVLPEGSRFKPTANVTRSEFAESLVRAGLVSQYMASSPMYPDVRDITTRSAVESVQSRPEGKLMFDAMPGSGFYPNDGVSRLVAAVAFVRAAGLENSATTAVLPITVLDTAAIPSQYRGYVALALENGFMTLDGNRFNPSRSITRVELAMATNALVVR